MNQSPDHALRGLGDALSALAQTLYEVESSPDLLFVKSQADAGGTSSGAATGVVDRLARLWDEYPLAKDVVDRLGAAVAAGDRATVDRLLGPDAVTLADGSTWYVGALIDDLRGRADGVVAEAARLAGAARQALARLDAAASALDGLVAQAGAVGATDDVEVEAAVAALRQATAAIAGDPTADGPLVALDRIPATHRAHAVAWVPDPRLGAPSCTFLAAVVEGSRVELATLGDCRSMWLPAEGEPQTLTEDDSWAAEVIAAGAKTAEEAYADHRAHVITRWLGADADPSWEARLSSFTAPGSGRLLLCSDGLWNYAETAAEVAAAAAPNETDPADDLLSTARRLTAFANAGGGSDNITVLLVDVPRPDSSQAKGPAA